MRNYRGLKALVTGADGFIGSHLTEHLAAAGADVTALACYNSFDSHGWLDEVPYGVRATLKLHRGDVRDAAFVQELVGGQDIVFHLAALIAIPYSYIAPQSYVETNVLGTLNVMQAARQHQVQRIVHTSTSEVYGSAITVPINESHPLRGQSPYSASKVAADMMAEAFSRSFKLPVTILRPFNAFGPRQSERAIIPTLIRQMLDPACEVIEVGDISTVRDFTFVDDTVNAFMQLGLAPSICLGQAYNAGSGMAITVGELVEMLAGLTGCKKPVRQMSERMRPAESEVRALLADSSLITASTGWNVTTSLRDGLCETIAWWRDRLERRLVRQTSEFVA